MYNLENPSLIITKKQKKNWLIIKIIILLFIILIMRNYINFLKKKIKWINL